MNLPWPKPWSRASILSAWMNRLLARCKQEVFLESKDFRKVQAAGGYFIESKVKTTAGKSTPSTPIEYAWFQIDQRKVGNDHFLGRQVTSMTTLVNLQGQTIPIAGTLGLDTPIAKQINMRRSIVQEVIDTVKFTFSNMGSGAGSDTDNQRQSQDGNGNTQFEFCYPRYVTMAEIITSSIYPNTQVPMWAQCYILAVKLPVGSGVYIADPVTHALSSIQWVEVGPPRVWVAP